MRLIDLDEVKKHYQDMLEWRQAFDDYEAGYLSGIESAIDTMEEIFESKSTEYQVVKRGKWKPNRGDNAFGVSLCNCSECGCEFIVSPQAIEDMHYCPHCGMEMDSRREKRRR